MTTAKQEGIQVVSHILKRMLEKNMFYFGSVDVNEASIAETVNQLTELQNAQVQLACKMYVLFHFLAIVTFFLL